MEFYGPLGAHQKARGMTPERWTYRYLLERTIVPAGWRIAEGEKHSIAGEMYRSGGRLVENYKMIIEHDDWFVVSRIGTGEILLFERKEP